VIIRNRQTPDSQRAVWRKRGSGSPESLWKLGSLSPVRTAVEAPPAPSPRTVGNPPFYREQITSMANGVILSK